MPRGDGTGPGPDGAGYGRRDRSSRSVRNKGRKTGSDRPAKGRGMERKKGWETTTKEPRYEADNTLYRETGGDDDIKALKEEEHILEVKLQALKERISRITGGATRQHVVAVVNEDKCRGCGVCAKVCPAGAITVDKVAEIGPTTCTGCGRCLTECPQ